MTLCAILRERRDALIIMCRCWMRHVIACEQSYYLGAYTWRTQWEPQAMLRLRLYARLERALLASCEASSSSSLAMVAREVWQCAVDLAAYQPRFACDPVQGTLRGRGV